jgi:integrase
LQNYILSSTLKRKETAPKTWGIVGFCNPPVTPETMPKQKFTDSFVRNITAEKRTDYYDTFTDGLMLRVSPTGVKSFAYRYFNADRSKYRRYTIGSYPAVSLKDARARVDEIRSMVKAVQDPVQQEREQKNALREKLSQVVTFNHLADRFEKRHLPTLRPKTSKEYRYIIKSVLRPAFGTLAAADVKRRDIVELLDHIAEDRGKPRYANLCRAVLSKMYSFGIEREYVLTNPVTGTKQKSAGLTKMGREKSRDIRYSVDEIAGIWQSVEDEYPTMKNLVRFLLLTGQRTGETCLMKWSDIDSKNMIWHIPQSDTKNSEPHEVPLSIQAQNIINELWDFAPGTEYVFHSVTDPGKPLNNVRIAERIRTRINNKNFRLHDLRHIVATGMIEHGVDFITVGRVLNHSGLSGGTQVTSRYINTDFRVQKRTALDKWANALERMISIDEQTPITKIGSL